MQVLYTTSAKSTGGRDGGHAVSGDNHLDVKLSLPKELGGPGGDGTNPEQLFAAGYSACFLGAIKFVAGQQKVQVPSNATVQATIGIGPIEGGFGIEAALEVSLPGIDRAKAEELVKTAHEKVCPYSNATRGNIKVTVTVV
ncbi:MAG TPA: organic hydroperoxide resistance protein [Dongiaceae bacterium]|nr:organic hydroperoxide resistance protein [Dongiaceae bacterium]